MNNSPLALIGYSGHAFVVYDIFTSQNLPVTAYCDTAPKPLNPFNLSYLGAETDVKTLAALKNYLYFISIGNNATRSRLYHYLCSALHYAPVNAIHEQAYVAQSVKLGNGVMVGAKAVINPLANIGNGVICNTGAVIEHECSVADFAHIAPNATLCGNVFVGQGSFIGAGAVVKEGVKIGQNATIGAGSVVIRHVPDGATVVGNPQRHL
ncbi:N-acetylneuraminate synthase [Sphingobacteriales bacterium UPWRP_1]|nr:N-acetylneuraminate synthase [Sphingobacteriales bacterium UPWRP_1]